MIRTLVISCAFVVCITSAWAEETVKDGESEEVKNNTKKRKIYKNGEMPWRGFVRAGLGWDFNATRNMASDDSALVRTGGEFEKVFSRQTYMRASGFYERNIPSGQISEWALALFGMHERRYQKGVTLRLIGQALTDRFFAAEADGQLNTNPFARWSLGANTAAQLVKKKGNLDALVGLRLTGRKVGGSEEYVVGGGELHAASSYFASKYLWGRVRFGLGRRHIDGLTIRELSGQDTLRDEAIGLTTLSAAGTLRSTPVRWLGLQASVRRRYQFDNQTKYYSGTLDRIILGAFLNVDPKWVVQATLEYNRRRHTERDVSPVTIPGENFLAAELDAMYWATKHFGVFGRYWLEQSSFALGLSGVNYTRQTILFGVGLRKNRNN